MTTTIKSFLDALDVFATPQEGYTYTSHADFVRDRGTYEVSGALTRDQRDYIRSLTQGETFRVKECFANAQRLVLADARSEQRLRYREGYAHASLFPVLHAWVVLDGARVIDPTWRVRDAKPVRTVRGEFPASWAYLGCNVASAEEIREQCVRTREWRSVIDNWRDGHPCLRMERLAPRPTALADKLHELREAFEPRPA